jgi:hypothetical protein
MINDGSIERRAVTAVIIAALAFAAMAGNAGAQGYWRDEYWQQQVDYEIRAELDPSTHTLTGSETIRYRNNSPDTLDQFYLHLYPNAYRDKSSQLIRDYMQGTLFFLVGLPESWRGWMDVTRLAVGGQETPFTVDGTILTAGLPQPLPPGGETVIEVTFTEKIRPVLGRAGYSGRHYTMAQWYPKVAVYDWLGWHDDQFRMGEFYGEFGTFDVHITLPEGYVIAATGTPVSGDPGWGRNGPGAMGGRGAEGGGHPGADGGPRKPPGEAGDGKKTVYFHAESVHDFAWAADPSFVVQDTVWNGVQVKSIYRPWNRSWADSVLAYTVRSLEWLEGLVGPYPYPQITVVDCPLHGGMEYPMLAMNGSSDESLVLHEVGHSYFYGALANDERAEAWLDEGLTQFQTFWYTEERYGPQGRPGRTSGKRTFWEGLAKPIIDLHRIGYAERIATPVHEFRNGYNRMVYVKAPLFLNALRYTVGEETFRKCLSTFFDRWKFKHVDEYAFLTVCEEVSGMDLAEIFKQWLHTTKACDYRMKSFKVEPEGEQYRARVTIERKGEMMMPLTLAFRLKNGDTEPRRVDGTLRTIEESFLFPAKPVSVAINPNNEILDIFFVDNFSPRRRDLALDNPFDGYRPPDAYQYRFLPIGYYNDIDGGKAGLRIRGGYDGRYKLFTLQGLYGFESETIDGYGSFEHPLRYFGRDASVRAEGYYREGRQGASLTIDKMRRESLTDPMAQKISVYGSYQELTDTAYVFPDSYEEGINLKAGITFYIEPKTDLFATSLWMAGETSSWGSDFDYQKFSLDARITPARRYPLPVKPYIRFFLGHSAVDPPLQEMYNLAGAGPLDKERYFWLRSVGAFPEDYYMNFHVPGDANLRGYYDGDFSFKRVFASNIELQLPFPLPVGRKASRLLDRRLYLFYDWGKVLSERPMEFLPIEVRQTLDPATFDGIISDFGAGLSLWKLTAEFPLYLSHPEISGEEERWDFRWTIGIHRLF